MSTGGPPVAVSIPVGDVQLAGDLTVPSSATGLVIFAHGSGSSRHSPRNVAVADALNARGLATLLFDLLTSAEERRDAVERSLRFDIGLLAGRLTAVVDSMVDRTKARSDLIGLPVGLFGASTGAAAALVTAADRRGEVGAVVSRGGRPDLAGPVLDRVAAPTLLVVGARDEVVLGLNRDAAQRLTGPAEIVVVPGATHLFEERGALDQVARLAGDWFLRHLSSAPRP
jgi:pimeloyl-ACP methyl ester carboxylesterase